MNCEICHIGRYQSTSAPYLRWLDDQIMIIPDVPTQICDVCGKAIYDAAIMEKLRFLLEHLTNNDQIDDSAMQHLMMHKFTNWQTIRRSR